MSNQVLINIGYLLVLLGLGYFFGRRAEAKHYKDIQRREQLYLALPTVSSEQPIGDISVQNCVLVRGSVVISVDYFKRMLAALRAFFGGEVQAYETLLDRARREAVLRMKESCPGAAQIINLRMETASIHRGANSIGSVEVVAYGTALFNSDSDSTSDGSANAEPIAVSSHPSRSGPTGD